MQVLGIVLPLLAFNQPSAYRSERNDERQAAIYIRWDLSTGLRAVLSHVIGGSAVIASLLTGKSWLNEILLRLRLIRVGISLVLTGALTRGVALLLLRILSVLGILWRLLLGGILLVLL